MHTCGVFDIVCQCLSFCGVFVLKLVASCFLDWVIWRRDSCTADDQPLPPRTIVRDELKESRQTLVDLQQKLADGSNKRGQEMPGQNDCFVLILFCLFYFT